MRTTQAGDRVQVHYVIRSQSGSRTSSHGRAPLELTVGLHHPRLPGLGLALVGLAPGERTTLTVPPERAYGQPDPARVGRWSRRRFPEQAALHPGKLVRITTEEGRRRLVRILEVHNKMVVVDTNHRWAGQALEIEVELVAIQSGQSGAVGSDLAAPRLAAADVDLASIPGRVVALDVDADSLAALRQALPGWDIDPLAGASKRSLARDWHPDTADLLVVGARDQLAETLGLCRELRSQAGRALTPLLVLVQPDQENFVSAALDAGAHSCLVLPVCSQDLAGVVARARKGNRPGRHTLNLDRAQRLDQWQDDGGEA